MTTTQRVCSLPVTHDTCPRYRRTMEGRMAENTFVCSHLPIFSLNGNGWVRSTHSAAARTGRAATALAQCASDYLFAAYTQPV